MLLPINKTTTYKSVPSVSFGLQTFKKGIPHDIGTKSGRGSQIMEKCSRKENGAKCQKIHFWVKVSNHHGF